MLNHLKRMMFLQILMKTATTMTKMMFLSSMLIPYLCSVLLPYLRVLLPYLRNVLLPYLSSMLTS